MEPKPPRLGPGKKVETPEERSNKSAETFLWGKNWPPPFRRRGNYAGAEMKRRRLAAKLALDKWLLGFHSPAPLPVGSFKPNGFRYL